MKLPGIGAVIVTLLLPPVAAARGTFLIHDALLFDGSGRHRASALAADHGGLADRGRLARGQAADPVLFDPQAIIDRATPQDLHEVSVGIPTVWVNGESVFQDGKTTGRRPGQVLRREAVAR